MLTLVKHIIKMHRHDPSSEQTQNLPQLAHNNWLIDSACMCVTPQSFMSRGHMRLIKRMAESKLCATSSSVVKWKKTEVTNGAVKYGKTDF